MKAFKWIAACLLLAAPATSHAIGASLSIGGGAESSSNTQFRSAFELSPFYEISILRLEVPLELKLKPASSFSIRPGAKLFIPLVGLYARAGYGFNNVISSLSNEQSLILGLGWEISAANVFGIFFEGTYEPSLNPSGITTVMGRAGLMLNL